MMREAIKAALQPAATLIRAILWPVNRILARVFADRAVPDSVLHVSYMVHIPFETVRHLRRQGIKADYLAIGKSPHWDKCDFNFVPSPIPPLRALQEFWLFWSVLARYRVVHAHFMYTISETGWELPVLKWMNRKLVAHFRGCEARDRIRNMQLYPDINICQACDHQPFVCQTTSAARRRAWAGKFADAILVTTPDMKDFIPAANHFPFFSPDLTKIAVPSARPGPFTIVHITNQPGIEGTAEIKSAVEHLRTRGHTIDFRWLNGMSHDEVLGAVADADIAVGKLKMGYYANAQIETMACGVPTITFVRDEFMTDELRNSGFIFTTLPKLADTIEYYIKNPTKLAAKRSVARESILKLHNNDALAQRLVGQYRELVGVK